jgi:hypothetical protein
MHQGESLLSRGSLLFLRPIDVWTGDATAIVYVELASMVDGMSCDGLPTQARVRFGILASMVEPASPLWATW